MRLVSEVQCLRYYCSLFGEREQSEKEKRERPEVFRTPMTQPDSVERLRRWPRHRIDIRLKITVAEDGNSSSAFGRGIALILVRLEEYFILDLTVADTT